MLLKKQYIVLVERSKSFFAKKEEVGVTPSFDRITKEGLGINSHSYLGEKKNQKISCSIMEEEE